MEYVRPCIVRAGILRQVHALYYNHALAEKTEVEISAAPAWAGKQDHLQTQEYNKQHHPHSSVLSTAANLHCLSASLTLPIRFSSSCL